MCKIFSVVSAVAELQQYLAKCLSNIHVKVRMQINATELCHAPC